MKPLSGTVFVGDSITARWPVESYISGAANSGVPGQMTDGMYPRFNREAIMRCPSVICLLGGTNDVIRKQKVNTSLIYYMADLARRNRIKVILATIPPIVSDSPGLSTTYLATLTAQWNASVQAIATDNGWPIADYHSAMINPDGSQIASMFIDGVHPSMAGYDAMWPVIQPHLIS